MASGVIYTPSTTFSFSSREYDGYPYDDRRPEYTPYPSSRPLPVPTQQQQVHQVWVPPSRSSTGSYVDPSFISPPPLRRSLADDPAFATDPNINPKNWYIQQSITPFPSYSHSGLDLPHGFVPQSGPVPNTSPRAHSHHEDTQPVYFVSPSISSSASGSSASNSSFVRPPRSSVRNSDYAQEHLDSPFRSFPPIEVQYTLPGEKQSHPRNGKHRPKRRSPHSAQPARNHVEASGAIIPSTVENPAGGVPRSLMSSMTISSPPDPSEYSKDGRRRSSSRLSPPDLSEHPRDSRGRPSSQSTPSDLSENPRDSRGRTSSRPSPPDLSENPRESRVRTSSRPTPPDLDSIDELDETNPYGFNVHHRGPYEAVAAILNEANPVDSPLLRVKGIQQQVSASARVRPSRHVKSEPTANPMSLNLQPGQILPNSIYQPTQPSHFPVEFSRGVHPPNHDIRVPRGPVEIPGAGHDTVTDGPPLRRNQTLPAANFARSPPEQSYQLPPPVTSEVLPYQRPYPTDSNVHQPSPPVSLPMDNVPSRSSGRRQTSRHPSEPPHAPLPSHSHPSQSTGVDHATKRRSRNTVPPSQIVPVASSAPPEAPPTPDLEQRLSHTLYLANPDETTGTSGHRLQGPLPTAPEIVYPSGERRSERPRRSYHGSLYGGQPALAPTRPTESEGRRRSTPRGSPPDKATTSEQDSPRRFEPPSQTIAAMNAQFSGRASSATSSSSRTSSSLAPRHVPKRLVMPTPLANSIEGAYLTAPSAATFTRANSGRPGQVLRKRNPRGDLRPHRTHSLPEQTVKGGIFSLFKFGKGSKTVVREVRVTEQPRAGMNEKEQYRVRMREEPRKLSKRK